MNALLAAFSLLLAGPLSPSVPADEPLKVCMLSGSEEYESDVTLARFQQELEANYRVRCVLLKSRGVNELPGLEALDDCDVALFFTRRLTIDGDSLARIKKYVEAGRPIVGVRTASHGFQNWLEFDKRVLGGNYQGHFKKELPMEVRVVPAAADHPVVAGVAPMTSTGSLYKNTPLSSHVTVLMRGVTSEGNEPVAWVHEFRGARIFYTSLGAQSDFPEPSFRKILTNALFWTARRPVATRQP